MNEFANYASEAAHKLLSDNRDLYVRQSAATENGRVADFPSPDRSAGSLPGHFPSEAA